MRFSRLDLTRYGKFTDQSVAFPASARDFHLIVGPNEAGKSTLRSAILDLLFGFPPRTALDFLHPKPDLRLAATLEHAGAGLDFVRVKANKHSLLQPDGTPLPDTALAPFLGQTSRAFFDKMFGLDHPRLVEGGNSILSAKDDVGQILFQSAAGVASLGRVRDQLEAEADSLWAPTRSARREYYIAKADLDEAADALKAATVRTKEWAEAQERVHAADTAVRELRKQLQDKQAERNRLERIRRVASAMLELRRCEANVAELGVVVDLPEDAAQRVADAERAQAMAEQRLALRRAEADRIAELLESINVDDTVLGSGEEISQLESLRHQYGPYADDIARAQGRVTMLWSEAFQAARELGWRTEPLVAGAAIPESAIVALQARLPGLPAMNSMSRLLRERESILQGLSHATQAALSRQADINALEAKLEGLRLQPVSARMRAALERANALGDADAALDILRARVDMAVAQQDIELGKLGDHAVAVEQLRRGAWPSVQTASRWATDRRALSDELKVAEARCADQRVAVEQARLAIDQFQQLHKTTSYDDVLQARSQRDAAWQAIKSGSVTPAEGAARLEAGIQRADELADLRHDKAQEAADLQGLEHRLQQQLQALAAAEERASACCQALAASDNLWSSRCAELGLPGMALENFPDWLVQKDKVLDSMRGVDQAEHELSTAKAVQAAVADELIAVLSSVGLREAQSQRQPSETVAVLRAQVRSFIQAADEAHIRRDEWLAQIAEARPALLLAQQAQQAAQDRHDAWERAWTEALKQAGLDPSMPAAAAEGALHLMSSIADKLDQLRQIRMETIARMREDLRLYAERVAATARSVGVQASPAALTDSREAFQLGQVLAHRLATARQALEQRAQLQAALQAEQEHGRAAEVALKEARASLKPLFDRAGVADHQALVEAVSRSDQRREFAARALAARTRLTEDGDGYS
ncbi:MAG TPA: AAA family ATPase, partial [Burkholderiaceae bacterium]|nr:AAA family ATPase [Burkholderiaceae bacterium]